MSELRVASTVDPAAWNAALCGLQGTVFHSAEWAAYVRSEQPNAVADYYTLIDDDGSTAGLALGFHDAASRSLAAVFNRRRWLDALPAVRGDSPDVLPRFIRSIEAHARRQGVVALRLGSFASPASEAVLSPLGFSIARRFEFELDLTQSEASLWSAIDVKRRQRIKKAMKNAVEVRELDAREGVVHLRQLQAASFERISARGGPSLNARDGSREDPIIGLARTGVGRVVGGFANGECVSASFFTVFNGLAYYSLSGHNAKALETQAPSLVLWHMLQRFQAEGLRKLNLGGCSAGAVEEGSPEHGVYTYKLAFGGTRLECGTGDKVLRPTIQRIAGVLRRVRR